MFAREFRPSTGRLVKSGPPSAGCGGMRPGAAPSRTANAAPGSLDQWSIPSTRAAGARPESPMPMPSRSVRPAGNRHSYGGYVAGADASDGPVTCQECRGQRQGVSGWRCRLPPALEAASPLGTSVCTRFRARLRGSAETAAACRRILACPASRGEGGHSRAGCQGPAGLPAPGTVTPARGLCAPGTAHGRAPPERVAGATLARSVRGHRFRAAACCCRRQHRDGPG